MHNWIIAAAEAWIIESSDATYISTCTITSTETQYNENLLEAPIFFLFWCGSIIFSCKINIKMVLLLGGLLLLLLLLPRGALGGLPLQDRLTHSGSLLVTGYTQDFQ